MAFLLLYAPIMERNLGGLDRSLAQGLAWTGGIRWTGQLVSWAITIVVARLLTPADYGLAGMVAVYTGFTLLLCEAGLTAALLRRHHTLPVAEAQLGGFAALLGVGGWLLSMLLAVPLARFFDQPAVRDIVMVASIGFIPRGLQILPRGIMARDLDFRRLAWIDGLEALGQALVTLTLALSGAGVWSLVGGTLSGAFIGAVASFTWSPQRLAWPRHFATIASDVIFGSKVLGSQLAWYAYSNADFAVVGWMLGPKLLGAYSVAWTLANIPVDRVSSLVSRVAPAYFAAASRDREQLRRHLLHLTEGLALVTFPACVGFALVAGDLVPVVLGAQWSAAVVPLAMLACMAAIRSIFVVGPPVLVFTGQVERNLWFSITCAVLLPVAFTIAAQWGIVAVALTWLLVYPLFASIFLFRHALRAVRLGWSEYLRALRDPALATGAMVAAVLLFQDLAVTTPATAKRLVLEVIVGAVVYVAVGALLAGRRVLQVLSLLRGPEPAVEGGEMPAVEPRRRLLLVSYHFPPDPAVGALRWRKLARHAAARGWTLDVIARDPRELPRADLSGLEDLPLDLNVHHVPTPPLPWATFPGRAWRWFRARRPGVAAAAHDVPESCAAEAIRWWPRERRDLSRMYFAWLDRHRGASWGQAAAHRARELLEREQFDAVVSCGPPHPPHPAIREVAHAAGVPFVLDLRDPWSLLQRLPEAVASPVWLGLARRDEGRCVADAALVVATTEAHRDALRRRYPEAQARIIAVRNGCDDDPIPRLSRESRFVVRYAGSIYLDRDPRQLFRAAARLIAAEGLTPDRFALEFMGHVSSHDGVPLEELARQEGVAEHVRVRPPRPRPEALDFLAGATMLALLPQDSDMAIPAKVFEYLRHPAWLLALAEPRSATAQLLQGTGADVVSAADAEGIFAVLARRYREHQAGVVPPALGDDPRFGRAAQAEALFDALERVVAPATARGVA